MGQAYDLLTGFPSVGPVVAAGLLAWLGPRAARFSGGRKAAAYFGMVASTYQSGQLDRGGHLTQTGPPVFRCLLVQAARALVSRI